jgi:hypothetical protein
MDNDTVIEDDFHRRVTILGISCILLSITILLMGRRIDSLESRVTHLYGEIASKKIKRMKAKPIPVFIVDAKSYEQDLEKANATDAT